MVSIIRNMVGKHSRRGGCRAEAAKRFDEDHRASRPQRLGHGRQMAGGQDGREAAALRHELMRLTHGKLAQGKRSAELAGSVADVLLVPASIIRGC